MDHSLALFLSFVFHDSPGRMWALFGMFSDLASCLTGIDDYFAREGVSEKSLGYYRRRIAGFDLGKVQEELNRAGVSVVFADESGFPLQLREIHHPPLLLYYKGDLGVLSRSMLGVVGTRDMTAYGQQATEKLVRELEGYFVVVSGLAEGVDTVAHSMALAGGYPTVAVVATGLDVVYPVSNTRLFGEICERGIVVSEFPLGVTGIAYRFPQRNRIVSGLCQGVLVIEAGEKSGALITARLAMEEGRDVFAVPGSIFSSMTVGTHRLIQDGAKMVTCVEDILSEFSYLVKSGTAKSIAKPVPELVLTGEEQAVWDVLGAEAVSIDGLVGQTGLGIAQVLQVLTLFEVKGWVEQSAGGVRLK